MVACVFHVFTSVVFGSACLARCHLATYAYAHTDANMGVSSSGGVQWSGTVGGI